MKEEIRTQISTVDQHVGLLLELIEQSDEGTLQRIEHLCYDLQSEITTYQEEQGYI